MPTRPFCSLALPRGRAYFFYIVLHDWTNEKTVEILRNIADAIEPGCSKLLRYEDVISTREPSLNITVANMTMATCFSSAERTKKEWRTLISRVEGQHVVRIWNERRAIGSIIEVKRV